MSRGLNKVMIIGRIQPNDPELKYTQSGQALCNFTVVTDESYKDKEGNTVERSEWHSITAWGKAGEIIAQYMKKGSQIYVEGRLQSRKYEDKEGQTRKVWDIIVSDFSFLDSAPRSSDTSGSGRDGGRDSAGAASTQASPSVAVSEDDLPF